MDHNASTQIKPIPLSRAKDILAELLNHTRQPMLSEVKDGQCDVCHEPWLTGQYPELPIKIPCGHIVGAGCILRWLSPLTANTKNSCPTCRAPILSLWNKIPVGIPPIRRAPDMDSSASTDRRMEEWSRSVYGRNRPPGLPWTPQGPSRPAIDGTLGDYSASPSRSVAFGHESPFPRAVRAPEATGAGEIGTASGHAGILLGDDAIVVDSEDQIRRDLNRLLPQLAQQQVVLREFLSRDY